MSTNPTPKRAQLDPPGPYETPVAIENLGAVVATTQLPMQLRLRLENGSILQIPVTRAVAEAIRKELEKYPEAPDWPQMGK